MWEVHFMLMATLVSGGAKLKELGVIMSSLGAILVVLLLVYLVAVLLRPEDVS